MGRLLKHMILFLIPVLIVVLLIPVDKRSKYQGLKDDCSNHALWVYDRVYNNPTDIDIAILGSSKALNGINDQLISDHCCEGQAVNFGYCRFGRNLSFVLLQDIIQGKDLKHLVIEVRERESQYSHPVFPYVARTRDVLLPNLFINRDIISDWWIHFAYKIELTQDRIFQQEPPEPIRMGEFGFGPVKGTLSPADLEKINQNRSKPGAVSRKMGRNLHAHFARGYLKRIHKICNRSNINVYFLYLPSYGTQSQKPQELHTYQRYGKVLIPPVEILQDHKNWYDENHLNQEGANALSLWISKQIGK